MGVVEGFYEVGNAVLSVPPTFPGFAERRGRRSLQGRPEAEKFFIFLKKVLAFF